MLVFLMITRAVVTTVFLTLAVPITAQAPTQIQDQPAAFDIVSIRPSGSSGEPSFGPTPDGYRSTNITLFAAILTAYVPLNGQSYYTTEHIKGAPDWLKSDRYDIQAKVAEGDLTRWHNTEQQKVMLRAMMQSLLTARCQLAVHRESKESPTFDLVVAKSGPHLKVADPNVPHPSGVSLPAGGTVVPGAGGQILNFYAASMASLALVLSNFSGRPVQDKTGLTGAYDFSLERETVDATSGSPAPPAPPIYSIIALGLRLEPSHNVVDTLVIDHIERPSEN
jgi:bla regulator protein BlaR1